MRKLNLSLEIYLCTNNDIKKINIDGYYVPLSKVGWTSSLLLELISEKDRVKDTEISEKYKKIKGRGKTIVLNIMTFIKAVAELETAENFTILFIPSSVLLLIKKKLKINWNEDLEISKFQQINIS